ncbi:hypothetical protein [Proteiniphilum sp.]|uniref:hypothetical protein n=1 Tax=Proteiniphilum sp. TaxID=1926877 RepID=UPI002B219F5E|nr:hypothetical protein [Proteiniphilum sp.]MEA4918998.1 hypothetical protein [Proteiniphilum sp.]
MKRSIIALSAGLCFLLPLHAQQEKPVKTTLQTSREWRPTIDVRSDAVMVYGVGGNPSDKSRRIPFEERVQSWRDRGYITHFMTGIAWGEYQDYFTGQWDGKMHLDEGQVQQNGDTIWHGHMVPYIVPSENFLTYLKEMHVKRVIDAGIDVIFMEEPEFWARAGYSEAFRKEWKKYYGFDWRPQHLSPENTYLANKLKYHLYYNALDEVFSFAKEYGKSKGMDVKCYVPTHSLVNYAQWKIVSPEASLASLPSVDGYIAQVWTGTSREPNYFNGKMKERVFETAFLEYGSMESMTAPTGREMFFLTDPIEDWPRDWGDYKKNYEATFTAQLLYPGIDKYEVMPWPERIYEGLYRTSHDSDKKERIPRHYSTQMQVMVNTLNHMPKSENRVDGSPGIGVLMSNSLMFQRFPEHDGYEDPQLANFYGQALPLLKRGVPVQTVHMENLSYPETLKNIKVLIGSYSGMKPMEEREHQFLAEWVKKGGILLYCGRDSDPFQQVTEWWNSNGKDYPTASAHLFELLGVPKPYAAGQYSVGKGQLHIVRNDPKEFVLTENGDTHFMELLKKLYSKATKKTLQWKNYFSLRRGPYLMVSVLDESVSQSPFVAEGCFIDLFDPEIPVLQKKVLHPGQQALLYDIDKIDNRKQPGVLATAARVSDEKRDGNRYTFTAKSPIQTTNVMRILLPGEASACKVTNKDGEPVDHHFSMDKKSGTVFLKFENDPDGINVQLEW